MIDLTSPIRTTNVTPMETNHIKLPDTNATEICADCDDCFKPEDGYTNAYGTFKCEECLCIDKKRN